jgi:hypothetical protein
MKITRPLAILAISMLALASAKAQSQLSGDCSCMAMSPRLRQQMEDSCPIYPSAGGSDYIQGETVRKGGTRGELVVRSPRIEAIDKEVQPRAVIVVDEERESVGYKATCHGITASPRTHQMLKDQRATVDLYTIR